MCNAHNHHPSCSCGWGGGNNSSFTSRYRDFLNNFRINYSDKVLEIFPTWNFSITVPNAFCPVCGEKVFFYQNSAGSRVFFDSLGKPWPKHPCTDNEKYSTKNGKIKDVFLENNFIIPNISHAKNEIKQKDVKIHEYFTYLRFIESGFGKKLIVFNKIKYIITEEFINSPDIVILTERDRKFYIETYEILSEVSQIIPLIPKDLEDLENLKHFGIDENETLTISINYAILNSVNLYNVKIFHYEKTMEMKLTNFIERRQKNIKYLRYKNDLNKNEFKVVYKNGELYEIE